MTLEAIKHNENLQFFTIPKDVFGSIFLHLKPSDLPSFNLSSRKCHEILKHFNLLGKLESHCALADQYVIQPWNRYFSNLYLAYAQINTTRELHLNEWNELKRLYTSLEMIVRPNIPAYAAKRSPVTLERPTPSELYLACPVENRSFFCKNVTFSEIHGKKFNEIVFLLMQQLASQPGQPYQAPVERIKTLTTDSAEKSHTLNTVIEEAVWSVLFLLKGDSIQTEEENCKKLVQVELGKMTSYEIQQLEAYLEKTFEMMKPIYAICKTIEYQQRHHNREKNFSRILEKGEDGNSISRLIQTSLLSHLIFHAIPTDTYYKLIGAVAVGVLAFHPTKLFHLPITTKIIEGADGAENFQHTPHPLRGRVRFCSNAILWGATVISILRLLNFF